MKPQAQRVAFLVLAFALLLGAAWSLSIVASSSPKATTRPPLRVLAYSSFVASWGPGPEIARRFLEKTGVPVEFRDSEDAGLLLKKLELFPSDVVLGFDQLMVPEARKAVQWKPLPEFGARYQQNEFVAFDWGPLAFVYRFGEVQPPPSSLDDLLDRRFARQITLQDPRTSSPGLQFLFWVLDRKGIDGGFEYLARLKPSLHTVASSWSASYGLFQSKQAKLTLSYLTSPVYHWVNDSGEENEDSYRAAVFVGGNPVQIEYAAVPASCSECDAAVEFVRFLLEPEIQKLIMEKNFMLPVVAGVENGTPFAKIPQFETLEIRSLPQLLEQREALLERWRKLGL